MALILVSVPNEVAYGQNYKADASLQNVAPSQPSDYYRPCDYKEENRKSDLCAQWNAVDWARSAFWVALAGAIGLVVTLIFNFEAWNRARKAERDTETALSHAGTSASAATRLAENAELMAKRELRAYLDFNGVKWRRRPHKDETGKVATGIHVSVKNYGRTPANGVVYTNRISIKIGEADPTQLAAVIPQRVEAISPSDHVNVYNNFDLPTDVWEALSNETAELISEITVAYSDVFEDPHILASSFESDGTGSEHHCAVEGTRKCT